MCALYTQSWQLIARQSVVICAIYLGHSHIETMQNIELAERSFIVEYMIFTAAASIEKCLSKTELFMLHNKGKWAFFLK